MKRFSVSFCSESSAAEQGLLGFVRCYQTPGHEGGTPPPSRHNRRLPDTSFGQM